jgi:ABC-type transport system involved in cytochrome c biogenesis permease subunit
MSPIDIELLALWSALVGYTAVAVLAIFGAVFGRHPERTVLAVVWASVVLHTVSLAARWIRLEHLPVGNPFEMLSANIWGLMLAVAIGYWRLPKLRVFAAVLMPIVIMVMAWMLLLDRADSLLPPTYRTVWLYIHIAFIKIFLGCAFIALGIGGIVLLRAAGIGRLRLAGLPADADLDARAYRFMALALIFDTLGIVAGAIWAQDAWGRYWSWDPLEIWSLLTWLAIGFTLHVRASFHTRPVTNALLILGTFLVAFFTFFGIPFVSTSLHKGQI